jgi:asparagine synthase (glutamine-hydrolysing)
LTGQDFAEGLYSTCQSLEVPTAHAGCVFLKSLYSQIKTKHKVCLVGEGADELFGGYSRYLQIRKNKLRATLGKIIPLKLIKLLPRLQSLERFSNLHPALVVQLLHDHNLMLKCFPELNIKNNYGSQIDQVVGFGNRVAAADQIYHLRPLLLRQDKIAMANSVESRSPFAHMPLNKEINKIPMRFRMPGGETKPLLKKVAEEWLPKELIYRRKQGLPLPLDKWMRDEKILKPRLMDICSSSSEIGKYADQAAINSMVKAFLQTDGCDQRLSKVVSQFLFLDVWLEAVSGEKISVKL